MISATARSANKEEVVDDVVRSYSGRSEDDDREDDSNSSSSCSLQ